jgi:putative radical SAM enzyme (TIGR03279 family)
MMELGNYKEKRNIIEDIVIGSIAEELEIEPGDILLSINGTKIKDVIDYKYLISDDLLEVEIGKKNGEIWELEIEKDYNEDLGIIFTNPLIDKAKTCKNKCMFCFIDQLPPNMRDTLYFKDDDSRLSFLQGNFITLTNMSEDDIERIIKYRLSPINVSVHTTNPELRVKMLNNKNAGKVYEILKRFHEASLEVNCQIVLVPGVNDGKELVRTIDDLSSLYPTIESVAVVPVGVTKYREHLAKLKTYDKESSTKLLEDILIIQEKFLAKMESRFIFPSDEFYCLADMELPSYEDYEGFPQYENGVGLMKSFEYEVEEELEKIKIPIKTEGKFIIATGTLAYEFICDIVNKIKKKFINLELVVIPIENNFFGKTITVSGLVTGIDLINQLRNCKDADKIIIPKSMLKRDEDIFLDNITIDEVEKQLNKKIIASNVDGKEFIEFLKLGVM